MIRSSQRGKRNVNCFQLEQCKHIKIASRRGNFSWWKNPTFVLLQGALPPGPPTGRCPCTLLGDSAAPDPLPSVGAFSPQCRLLSYILLLLQVFLTTRLTDYRLSAACWLKGLLKAVTWQSADSFFFEEFVFTITFNCMKQLNLFLLEQIPTISKTSEQTFLAMWSLGTQESKSASQVHASHVNTQTRPKIAEYRQCRPSRPFTPWFVRWRILTVTARGTLTTSFMTYHAIDLCYAVLFSLRKKKFPC